MGTVIEEKPYPSAPLTVAASSVIRIKTSALEVTCIASDSFGGAYKSKKPDHAGWPGLGEAQKARGLRASSCRHWVRRDVRPTPRVEATTTERTHGRNAHVSAT